jgi:hypothetical protein
VLCNLYKRKYILCCGEEVGEGGDLVTTITNRITRGDLGKDITVTVDRTRPQFATNPALTTFSYEATTSLLLLALSSFPGCLSFF